MSITVDLSGTDNLPSVYGLLRAAPKLGERIDGMSAAYAHAQTKWQSLTEHYRAPEQHLVYAALDKPRDDSESVADAVASSVTALEAFAEAVEAIRKKRATLKADIAAADQADVAEDKARAEDDKSNFLHNLYDLGEDWLIRRHLQERADALAEELRTAEDECIRAHSRLARNTVDVVSSYGGNKDEYIAQDVSQAYNRVQNSIGDPTAAMQQYLSLLTALTPAQMALFLKHNPGAPLSVPPLGADPKQNKEFWDNLPQDKRTALAQALPSLVGNMEGIPYSDRIAANNAALERALHQRGLSQARRDTLLEIREAAKQKVEGTARGIVSLDTGNPPLAAIAIGNLDTADRVTWNVPGMGTTADSMEEWCRASQNLLDAQNKLGLTGNAVVAWVGYHAPPKVEESLDVLDTSLADAGGDRLAASLNGFNISSGARSPYVSVAAHSYGTTTSAYGLTRTTFDVDSVAFYGSAGVDPAVVDHASDLHVKNASDGQPAFYATNAAEDIVAPGGSIVSRRLNPIDPYNFDPLNPWTADSDFDAHVFSSDGDPGRGLEPTLGHSVVGEAASSDNPIETARGHGYLDPRTQSVDSVARITTGMGDDVLERDQEIRAGQSAREERIEELISDMGGYPGGYYPMDPSAR